MTFRSFEKYLRRNPPHSAAPDLHALSCARGLVVIPVCDENDFLPETLSSLEVARGDRPVALLLVFNHPAGAAAAAAANAALLAQVRACSASGIFAFDAGVLENGVGEARKLGFDAALHALAPEALHDFLFYSCDADAPVEPDYFEVVERAYADAPECAAFVPGLRHAPGATPELECAVRAYEAYCRSYYEGLRGAGSPYAYWTVGSAITCRAEAYCAAGGMRVRRTGEDFYFLEALAKSSGFAVRQLSRELVHPAARLSHRVPVGTGTKLAELLAGSELPVYPREAWAELRALLATAQNDALADADVFLARVSPRTQLFLERNRFSATWGAVVLHTPPERRRAAFLRWFDALKTLQFLKAPFPGR